MPYNISPAQEDFLVDLLCAAYDQINNHYTGNDARKCTRYCEQHLIGFMSYLDIDNDKMSDIIRDANQQYLNVVIERSNKLK